jgi:murein DD-endopeptidase MepM/ murein hydrolase activator NlpD
MHLRSKSPLRVGSVIGAGRGIGQVGQTGRAYGCHLHFEFWRGPWQTGGRPVDPLPYLRSLLRR